ncbi:hypothetical protein K377_07280 [Streptomyces sp. PsTaAH-137]|nr:hypothetical protein K377_07280 [Streptomyces sp. PsTaAH-137]
MSECPEHRQGLNWFTVQEPKGNGACVEGVLLGEGSVAVRFSKDRDTWPFMRGGHGWSRLVQSAGAGLFGSAG